MRDIILHLFFGITLHIYGMNTANKMQYIQLLTISKYFEVKLAVKTIVEYMACPLYQDLLGSFYRNEYHHSNFSVYGNKGRLYVVISDG